MNDKATVQLFEYNGGGLHMALVKDGACVAFVSGLEFAWPGSMTGEMVSALRHGMKDWSNSAEDPATVYADMQGEAEANPTGVVLVAEAKNVEHGPGITVDIAIDSMGAAARRYAGYEG